MTERWGSALKVEEQPQCLPCSAPLIIKHVLVDCVDLAPTRQRFRRQYGFLVRYCKVGDTVEFDSVKFELVYDFKKKIYLYKRIQF